MGGFFPVRGRVGVEVRRHMQPFLWARAAGNVFISTRINYFISSRYLTHKTIW